MSSPGAGPRWSGRQLLLSRTLSRTFRLWERLGVHVTPRHFYSPIPATSSLRPDLWNRESELVGIDLGEERQLALLERFEREFRREYEHLPAERTRLAHEFSFDNKTFLGVDAELLYCFIRSSRPRRVVEIGSGQSTYLAAQALRRNAEDGHPGELVVVDPYPTPPVRNGFKGLTRLIAAPVESTDLKLFEALADGDILFIDSTHVLRIGGDVQFEFLEILPRLQPGVLVQIHDIFLPTEYPREWVAGDRLFFSEQYLLQAFLTFNREFEVLWSGHYLHRRHPEKLARAFPSYDPQTTQPGSFWIRRMLNEPGCA